jgi:ribosomal protein L14
MAVTGHKSASSVAVYQRVSSKEKQVMGDIITSSVRGEQPSQLSSIMRETISIIKMLTISKTLVWPRDLESFKGRNFNTLSLVD